MNMKTKITLLAVLLAAGLGRLHAGDANALWDKNCAACHGKDGKGETKMGKKLGMKDFTDAKVQAELKDEDAAKAIKDGVKDGDKTRMKGFADSLSEEEVKALVQKVRSFKQ